MYNRYFGNSGRVIRVQEPEKRRANTPRPAPVPLYNPPSPPAPARPDPLSGLREGLGSLLGKIRLPENLETEDLLIGLVLYLLYRESGDIEMLIILAAMLFL